jgi:hypothetical protein
LRFTGLSKIEIFYLNLGMEVEIRKEDTPEDIDKKLKAFLAKKTEERKIRLGKLFGSIKLKEDALTLQRRWRDEW